MPRDRLPWRRETAAGYEEGAGVFNGDVGFITAVDPEDSSLTVLFDEEKRNEIRGEFGLEGKRVFAYMPTWRGTGRNADIRKQVEEAETVVSQIEKNLGEDEVLFVNFHFLI